MKIIEGYVKETDASYLRNSEQALACKDNVAILPFLIDKDKCEGKFGYRKRIVIIVED